MAMDFPTQSTSPGVAAGQTGGNWLLMLGVLVLADVASGIEAMMIYAAMKTLITLYGDPAYAGWLITAYLLVSASAGAICGRLGDIYGRKLVILVVLACAVAGSLISAMTENFGLMVAGRALQGMSGSILPLSFGLAREILPAKRVPLGVGILYSAGTIGAMGGLVMGGALVDAGHWHKVFLVAAIAAVIPFVLAAIILPKAARRPAQHKLDKIGGLMFAPAVTAILLGLSNMRSWGFVDARTLGLLLGGIALMIGWYRHELRHPHPLIDVRLFTRREMLTAAGCLALYGGGAAQIVQAYMLLLQQPASTGIGLGVSATLAGLMMMGPNFGATLMSPLGGFLAGRRGNRFVVMTGFAINAAGWILLACFNDNIWAVEAITFICLSGNALLGVGIFNAIIQAAPLDRTSEASGMGQVVHGISRATGAQLIMVILGASTVADATGRMHPAPITFLGVFALIAACGIIGVLLGSRLRGRPATDADMASSESPAPLRGARQSA